MIILYLHRIYLKLIPLSYLREYLFDPFCQTPPQNYLTVFGGPYHMIFQIIDRMACSFYGAHAVLIPCFIASRTCLHPPSRAGRYSTGIFYKPLLKVDRTLINIFHCWKRRNICIATSWIGDWNISILWELVNRHFQKGIVKRGYLLAPTSHARQRLWGSTITSGNPRLQMNSWKSYRNILNGRPDRDLRDRLRELINGNCKRIYCARISLLY